MLSQIPITPLPQEMDTDVPQETIQAIQEVLKNNYSSFEAVANIVYYSCDEYIAETHLPCHAELARLDASQLGRAIGTENAAKRTHGGDYKALTGPFLRWFLWGSHYGPIILNRDDWDFCRDYGFVIATEVPAALFLNACIVSRHFRECSDASFERFNYLTEEVGIDPYLAYVYAFQCRNSNKTSEWKLDANYQGYQGHRVSYSPNWRQALNWYTGSVQPHNLAAIEPMREYKSIWGCSKHFFEAEADSFGGEPEVQDLLAAHRGKKIEKYSPPNPFVATAREEGGDGFTYAEVEKIILPYYQQQIQKQLAGGADVHVAAA